MMGRRLEKQLKRVGAVLAALALMLSIQAMTPPLHGTGFDIETCVHNASGPAQHAPSITDKQCCDICVAHCSVSWGAAATTGEPILYQPMAQSVARADISRPIVRDFSAYQLSRPRGPPVSV